MSCSFSSKAYPFPLCTRINSILNVFCTKVKEELSYVEGASRHCQLAELAALVLCCGRLVDKKMDDDDENSCINKTLLFESENETVLRKYFTFVQKTFNIELMRVHSKELTLLTPPTDSDVTLLLHRKAPPLPAWKRRLLLFLSYFLLPSFSISLWSSLSP